MNDQQTEPTNTGISYSATCSRSCLRAVRFRFVLRVVQGVALHVVEGPVQGAGGFVSRLADLEAQRALNASGRPLTIYEPDAGHVEVFPEYTAESDGPGVRIHISKLVGLAEEPSS